MRNIFFDLHELRFEAFLVNTNSTDSGSFVYNKYTNGRPNNSPPSTEEGTQLALERILVQKQDSNAFFGVHIKETINQFRNLFGKK